VDWTSLANLDGTLVCYAGPDQLPRILTELLDKGRSGGDSGALIYNGNAADAGETIFGSLTEIAKAVEQRNDRRAGVLVVGRVTALREHLRWFDARPLFGKRVLITRPREQAEDFVALLESFGADPIEAPMIRILPPADFGPLDAACARIGDFTGSCSRASTPSTPSWGGCSLHRWTCGRSGA